MGPSEEYRRRRDQRKAELQRFRAREESVSNVRLGLFFGSFVLIWLAAADTIGWIWPGTAGAIFVALGVVDSRLAARRRRLEGGLAHFEAGLARLEDRWAGQGRRGEEYAGADHPYAADLDIFGRASLFELVATVQTRPGEEMLARWLTDPAGPPEIRRRQGAISDLRGRVDLREELAVLSGDAASRLKVETMSEWGSMGSQLPVRSIRWIAAALTALMAASLAAWAWGPGAVPFLIVLVAQLIFMRAARDRVSKITSAVDRSERELAALAAIMARLAREPVSSPRLSELRSALEQGSRKLARLARIVQLLDSSRNEMFLPVTFLLMWRTHVAFAIESWRSAHGREIPAWLAAVGEFEALGALAGYSFEHPDDPFPEIAEEGAVFEAEAIGHPLIPESACVRNDLAFGARRVFIVSGSNMSGKSTLLRTIGINAVLAFAGAPVRARRLRISLLSVGATLRIQDSLQAGTSRFFAEITRLRRLVDLAAGPRPLLFLLDEILHGTNSHDRRIGAEAVIRELVSRGAIGLVTTHDLALAEAERSLDGRAANVHFEDRIENGRLIFDYRLREGVVTRSNALELMRSIGLSV